MSGSSRRDQEDKFDCAVCGDSLSERRPHYCVVLEIEDRTRSTKQFMGSETNIKRHCLDRTLCEQCWQAYYDKFD